jgi:hypothetical protein
MSCQIDTIITPLIGIVDTPKPILECVTFANEFLKYNPLFTHMANNYVAFSFPIFCHLIGSFVIYSPNNHLLDKCTIVTNRQTNNTNVNFPIIQSKYDHMYYVNFDKNKLNLVEPHEIILQFDKPYQNDTNITIYYNAIYVSHNMYKIIGDSHILLFSFDNISNKHDTNEHIWDIDMYDYETFMNMYKDDPTLFVNKIRWNKNYDTLKWLINDIIRMKVDNVCEFNALELLMNEKNVFFTGSFNLRHQILKNMNFSFK